MHFLQFCNIFYLICVQLFLIAFLAVRTRRLLTSLWGPTLATQVAMSLRLRGLFGISAAQLVFVFCFDSHLAPAEFCFLFFFSPILILLLSWEILCDMRRLFVIEMDSREPRERERAKSGLLSAGVAVWNLCVELDWVLCFDKSALPLKCAKVLHSTTT